MAETVYDCLFLLDSNHFARDPQGQGDRLSEIVENVGGEILASRLYNEQKLAYPVDGHKKGTYWLMYFRMDGTRMPEFNRACQLNESLLRHLAVKVDPRLVDVLVAHARGETLPTDEGGEPAAPAAAGAGAPARA